MSELSREDYESVERAGLELHARGWRKAFSLNEMLEAYEQLVSKVEEGYDEVIDEYANDLSCRDWWRSPGRSSPTACAGAVQQNWRLWTTGLGAATVDDAGRALSRYFAVEQKGGWWWRRRPLRAAGIFAADFLSESPRNHGPPVSLWWSSKVVSRVALAADVPRLSIRRAGGALGLASAPRLQPAAPTNYSPRARTARQR